MIKLITTTAFAVAIGCATFFTSSTYAGELQKLSSNQKSQSSVLIAQNNRIPVYYGMSDWGKPVYIAIANGQVYALTPQGWSETGVFAHGSVFEQMMRRFRFVGYLRGSLR